MRVNIKSAEVVTEYQSQNKETINGKCKMEMAKCQWQNGNGKMTTAMIICRVNGYLETQVSRSFGLLGKLQEKARRG